MYYGAGRLIVSGRLQNVLPIVVIIAPSFTEISTFSIATPSASLPSSCFEISGSMVFERILSTLRAPLSTSVQREAISFSSRSS